MKRLPFYIACFCLLIGNLYAVDTPWSDKNSIELQLWGSEGTAVGFRHYPYLDSVYSERFGATPDFILWSDATDIPCWTMMSMKFVSATSAPKPTSEVLGYLYVFATSVTDSDSMWVEMSDVAFDTSDIIESYSNKYMYSWKMDFSKVGIPDDGSTWRLRIEVWDSPPPGGNLIVQLDEKSQPNLVRMKRETPLDTLQWGIHSGLLNEDRDADRWMLSYYPNNLFLLTMMVMDAYTNQNCDSLRYYAERYLDSKLNRRDPIFMDRGFLHYSGTDSDPGPPPLRHSDYEGIVDWILYVCKDTTGLGQYEPVLDDSVASFDLEQWLEGRQTSQGKD